MDTDIASDSDSLPDIADKCEEGELSDLDQDISLTDADQVLSEEQNYTALGCTWGGRTYRM